jgi:hypothetical protein
MLDLCHWYLLSTRLMLTQHSAVLAAIQLSSSSSDSSNSTGPSSTAAPSTRIISATQSATAVTAGSLEVGHYHEPGHRTTNLDQAYTPPHQQLVMVSSAGPISLIKRHAAVADLISNVVEDCR